MQKLISNQKSKLSQKINISDVVISNVSQTLYDYSNRDSEFDAVKESISTFGQLQPITVARYGSQYVVIDGVLRLLVLKYLNLNEIDAIVCDFVISNESSLSDLIIHHHIRKRRTPNERLNEIKSLLRVNTSTKQKLRDKEQRITLVTSLLGRGWARNNVISFEKILRWEKSTNSTLRLAEKIFSEEITVHKALDIIKLIENPLFDIKKESESQIVEGFIQGKYRADKALNLMETYNRKKAESYTTVKLFPSEGKNYTLIHGNIEDIDLPSDLEIDTIFTSPPYYKIVKYGGDSDELGWEQTPEEYIKRLANILMKCFQKLKPTGSMYINLGESFYDQQCYGITERLVVELIGKGARYVDRIIWKKDANKPIGNKVKRLNPGYESILHFSKTKDYYFERFRIQKDLPLRIAAGCKEKGSREIGYHIPNNYSQFRDILIENEVSSVLSVQLGKNRTKHVEGEEVHPATFSSNLPVIPLLISTPKNRDSVVFDPFAGSSSCGVTATLLGFKFVGVELYEKNIQTSQRVLSECQEMFNEDSLNSFLKCIGSSDESDDLSENNQAA